MTIQEYLNNLPTIDMGKHPILGKATFKVVKCKLDNNTISIDWQQKMSKTCNYLKGHTIFEVIDDELKVTNCASFKRPMNDIAGIVVNMLSSKFGLSNNYDRHNPSTFNTKVID